MNTKTLRWGIIGTGRIAREFAAGIAHSRHGELVAVASRTPITELATEFGTARCYSGYAALLDDKSVDAVYVATPHPMHAEWAIRAAEAGKHVLCEKPIGMNAAEADAIIDAARRHKVFLMEAFMYRAHPQTEALTALVRSGEIGDIRLIEASFGFNKAFDPAGRQYDPALGGGGILDVGCYPMSMVRLIAGAAAGKPFADPITVQGAGHLGETGVDEWAAATLTFPNGLIAQIAAGVALAQANVVRVFGTAGRIEVASPWWCSGKQGGRSVITVTRTGEAPKEIVIETTDWIYALEAYTVAINLAAGQSPAMSWDDTLGNMRALDAWRAAIGLTYPVEQPGGRALPLSGRRLRAPPSSAMPMLRLADIAIPASRLGLGTSSLPSYADGAPLLDAFFEAGGTLFDSAFHYGSGRADTILGHWMHSRGVRDNVVVIGKGAHTPNCNPEAVNTQLLQSLERLQTDHIDIYFLHRDNLDIPVSEWVDVLDDHYRAGRIRTVGGSNWTPARFDEANAYARKQGRVQLRHLSNQFSLAEMLEPVWAGCISASDDASLAWLQRTGTNLFAWSSQARGFFAGRDDPAFARNWGSEANFARRDRAQELARRKNTGMPAIALAYVLAQRLPIFALIGPLNFSELRSSLAALETPLTPEEADWLRNGSQLAP